MLGKIDLEKKKKEEPKEKEKEPGKVEPVAEVEKPQVPEMELIKAKADKLQGLAKATIAALFP